MAEQNLDIVVRVRGGQVAATEIKGVGGAVETVGTQTEQTSKKTSGLSQSLKAVATAAVVYKGFNYLKSAVKDTGDLAKSTLGLRRITGLDSQTAAGWIELGKERGIQSKQLNQGFITLNKNIYAATGTSKTAKAAFAALGLDAAALKSANATDRMAQLADAFDKLPPGVDKAALAQKMFGRQAQNMLPILAAGGKALTEHTRALGKQSGMTDQTSKQAMEFIKVQREWQATQMQLKVAIGTALMPILVALAQVISPIARAFANAMTSSGLFRSAVYVVTAALIAFVAVVALANIGLIALNAYWLWIPAAIAAVIAILILLYTKVKFVHNGVNAFGKAAVAAFNFLKQGAMTAFNWVKSNWPLIVSILGGPMAAAAVQIIKHWDAIKGAASSVLGFFQKVAGYIGGAFAGAWNAAASAVKGVTSAIQDVINVAKKVTSLPGKGLNLVRSMVPGMQAGGTVTHAGSVLVGEVGPEVVHLPAGAHVTPNHALGGRGGGGGRVVVPVYLDTRQIATAFGEYTADQQATR
jgi:phage-related protein